jgi:hypothetical protein
MNGLIKNCDVKINCNKNADPALKPMGIDPKPCLNICIPSAACYITVDFAMAALKTQH